MVKTDFKNIYEAFMHCDTNKLKKEFAAMYSDNEEQAAAVKEVDRAFARIETITPKAANPDEQSIIVVCKGFGDEGDDTVCIEVEDRAYENTLEDRLDAIRLSKRYMEQFVI